MNETLDQQKKDLKENKRELRMVLYLDDKTNGFEDSRLV